MQTRTEAEGDEGNNLKLIALKHVFAIGIGNGLEFYDWMTFAFFSLQISHSFFPKELTSNGLIYSLAIFGAGFFMRPLGAIVIGSLGDRQGRKPAMLLSFGLMGVGVIGVALTPSFATIGFAAPVILLGFRLVQGFALGGEIGPSTAALLEMAPLHRRGQYVAMQFATQNLSTVVAGGVGFTLASLLTPEELGSWGWRVAFLGGAAIVPFGLMIRNRLPETLHLAGASEQGGAGRPVTLAMAVGGLLLIGQGSTLTYSVDYISTFAQDSLHLSAKLAFGAALINGVTCVICDVLSGMMSDRLGRRPVVLTAQALLLLTAIPVYLLISRHPGIGLLYAGSALLAGLKSFVIGPAFVAMTESLPKAIRSRGLSIVYALGLAIFGGTTQFGVKALLDATGSRLIPAFYMTAAVCIGVVVIVKMRETAPVKILANAEDSADPVLAAEGAG